MLIGYCDSCRYLDLINEKSECNCPRCSRTLRSLGINSAEWNKLPDEEKYDLSKIADRVDKIRKIDEEKKQKAVKAEADVIEKTATSGKAGTTKQTELVMKLMTYGIPQNIQDIIGDKLQEYKGSGKSEEIASSLINIIESPGDTSDSIEKINNLRIE